MADEKKRTIRFVAPEGVGPFLVQRFSGTEALGRLYEYRVELLSEDAEIAFADLMGQPVAMVLAARNAGAGNGASGERIVHGLVSRFVQAEKLGRYTQYEATIVPYLWFLNRVAECRIMPTMLTVPAIVKKILGDRHFTEVDDSRLIGHYLPRPYCVQYRETDFNFVSRLLEDEGIYYHFEHKREGNGDKFKHVMVLGDAPSNHKPGEGCDPLHVADQEDEKASRVDATLWSWTASGQAHADQARLTDFRYETRAVMPAAGKVTYAESVPAFAPPAPDLKLSVEDFPAGFHLGYEATDRDKLASIRAEERAARRVVRQGITNVHGAFPGVTIKLDTQPPEEHLIVAARFRGWSDVGESGQAPPADEPYECALEAIDAKRPFRPARLTPRPRVVGPQTALVVGDASKNAFTDEFGCVRVKFHWDYAPDQDEKASCLVRVAEPWAGNKWGVMFMPRVGHEVVVEFLEGDPDRPLITGRLYNGLAKPPYDPRQHASVSTIKSMSTDDGRGYNELRFEDKKGSEQIYVHAQQRMDVRVGASLYETVAANREEHIGSGDKGDRNRLVSANLNDHVKNGVYELIDKKLHTNVKGEVAELYGDNHTIAASGRMNLNASETVIEGKNTASLKSDKVILQGGSSLSLKAGDIKIEATQSVSVKVGGSFFVMSPSGIGLAGGMAFLNSGGAPQPADAATAAQAPSLTAPIDAAVAATAVPGDHVAPGRSAPRKPVSIEAALHVSDEPPETPGAGPTPAGTADRAFLDIAWVEREAYCGGPATLKGKSKGYANGANEPAEIRNVVDGATVVAVPIVIRGNSFNQRVDVKDWMPRKGGAGFEEARDELALAGGKKTPRALTMRFIPTLESAECKLRSNLNIQARFTMAVTDYVCQVTESITYVRGRLGQLIKLGAHVPAGTLGGLDYDRGAEDESALSGKDWRFARKEPGAEGKLSYWNGKAWAPVPDSWKDQPVGTKIFSIGIWRDGAKKRTEIGVDWPGDIADWTDDESAKVDKQIPKWADQIKNAYSNQFDLRREGCSSSNVKCCRYSVEVTATFEPTEASKMDAHTIVIAPESGRSNSLAWSVEDRSPFTAGHEFGHHLACADEYPGSDVLDKSVLTDIPDPSQPGVDTTTFMGANRLSTVPVVKARHFDTIKRHLANMIREQKGVTMTFTATPHV